MERRSLGRSGLKTPRLVLGGNVFGHTAKGEDAFAILDRFIDAGGTIIDTADVYSAWVPSHKGGESEALLGEWLKRRGGRDQVLIATKVGYAGGLSRAHIEQAVDGSLRRLGIDTIDLYYAHKDDPETPLAETLQALDALVQAGKVRTIGASNYSAPRLVEALDISEAQGLARFEVLQPLYNLMERDEFEGDLQRLCIDREIGVLPYFGLASGFLTGKYRSQADLGKSKRGDAVAKYLGECGNGVLDALDIVAEETAATPAQVALAWLAAQPSVTAPIASATTMAQIEDLAGAMTLELRADQVERLTLASTKAA